MKTTIPYLKRGEALQVKVLDILEPDVFIIEVGGDLLRVNNTAQRKLKVGQSVVLIVKSLQPLSFCFADENRTNLEIYC